MSTAYAQGADFELRIAAPSTVLPGSELGASLVGRSPLPLIGYSASIHYDNGVLTLNRVTVEGTVWESADLVFIQQHAGQGGVSIGVILDKDGAGMRQVEAFTPTTFARLEFAAAMVDPTVATIGFADSRDFNMLVDTDLNGHDPTTGLLLTQARIELRAEGLVFVRSDCNNDDGTDMADAVFLLKYLFVSGPRPVCEDACDTNDSGSLDVSDAIRLLLYLFRGGEPPRPPFPQPGTDLTADSLRCPVR
jgi:hypothetical protein